MSTPSSPAPHPAADAARESARQGNGQFGTQAKAEADVELAPPAPMTLEAAGEELQLADEAVIEAKLRAEYAALAYAAIKVTERYPEARYLVFDSAEDESWEVYVSHATDADGNSLVDFSDEDRFSDWTRDLQVAVMALPRGSVSTVPSQRYPTELNDLEEPYRVDIHDIFRGDGD